MGSPVDIDIRRAGPEDVEGIVSLIVTCDESYVVWAPDGWQPPDGGRERVRWNVRLSEDSHVAEVAVERSGRVVGVVTWTRSFAVPDELAEPGRRLAHVSGLFVHPERWRQGIAAELLDRAELAMRARGFGLAELWTPEDAPARSFYEARGWRRDGRREWFEELALPIVGYAKTLAG